MIFYTLRLYYVMTLDAMFHYHEVRLAHHVSLYKTVCGLAVLWMYVHTNITVHRGNISNMKADPKKFIVRKPPLFVQTKLSSYFVIPLTRCSPCRAFTIGTSTEDRGRQRLKKKTAALSCLAPYSALVGEEDRL